MPDRISEKFGLKSEQFGKEGVFDGFWDVDSQFHVDPALLRVTKVPELKDAEQSFQKHFSDVLKLIVKSKSDDDPMAKAAIKRLTFPEIHEAALGFSTDSTRGRGWSPLLAKRIFKTAKQIVEAGVEDPAIFELAGVLEDDIGADLVSDMTLQIILPHLVAFNERVITKLKLPSLPTSIGSTNCRLPFLEAEQRFLLLLPADILSPMPVAESWEDIHKVCTYNAKLRDQMNATIGSTWKQAFNNLKKSELRDALLREPEALRDLLQTYRKKEAKPYNFEADPLGEIIWRDIAQDASAEAPLELKQPASHKDVVQVVKALIEQFKQNVENNGLREFMFNDDGSQRPERFSQLLFYGIADCYCRANNIDLSREPNAGRGPVDFKMSKGYDSRVLVEIKLSSNSRLPHGFSKQVEAYQTAEQSREEFVVVVIVGAHESRLKIIQEMRNEYIEAKKRVPNLILVEAQPQASASKA
jgi:hypothetical protein